MLIHICLISKDHESFIKLTKIKIFLRNTPIFYKAFHSKFFLLSYFLLVEKIYWFFPWYHTHNFFSSSLCCVAVCYKEKCIKEKLLYRKRKFCILITKLRKENFRKINVLWGNIFNEKCKERYLKHLFLVNRIQIVFCIFRSEPVSYIIIFLPGMRLVSLSI